MCSPRRHSLLPPVQVCAHLHSPELARAFAFWNWLLEQRAQLKKERALAALEKTLEGKLRQSQFEAGQLAMLKVAHEDEIGALTKQLAEATELAASKERLLQEALGNLEGSQSADEELALARAQAADAAAAREEMAAELASHREKHESLLQRLLAEQRARLEEDVNKLQRQLALKGEEHGGALQALKEQVSAEAAAKAREERIELLRRSAVRRIKNKDLSAGWGAWHARWAAKAYALGRLRACANKLHTPGLTAAFEAWADWWTELKREQLEEQLGAGNSAYEALQVRAAHPPPPPPLARRCQRPSHPAAFPLCRPRLRRGTGKAPG